MASIKTRDIVSMVTCQNVVLNELVMLANFGDNLVQRTGYGFRAMPQLIY